MCCNILSFLNNSGLILSFKYLKILMDVKTVFMFCGVFLAIFPTVLLFYIVGLKTFDTYLFYFIIFIASLLVI